MEKRLDINLQAVDFRAEAADLQRVAGNHYTKNRLTLHIGGARYWLGSGLKAFCREPQWLPEYEQIANWMEDSKGKGLCLAGNCGLGKTLICTQILPVVFKQHGIILPTFTAPEMNTKTAQIIAADKKVIDDIGIEGEKVDYGERKMCFSEIIDMVERKGGFIIVTTNLNPDEIYVKYGLRTAERLRAVTRLITLRGQSLRR